MKTYLILSKDKLIVLARKIPSQLKKNGFSMRFVNNKHINNIPTMVQLFNYNKWRIINKNAPTISVNEYNSAYNGFKFNQDYRMPKNFYNNQIFNECSYHNYYKVLKHNNINLKNGNTYIFNGINQIDKELLYYYSNYNGQEFMTDNGDGYPFPPKYDWRDEEGIIYLFRINAKPLSKVITFNLQKPTKILDTNKSDKAFRYLK